MRTIYGVGFVAFLAGCHLPPPTTANLHEINGSSSDPPPALTPAINYIDPAWLKDELKPVCSVQNGKEVNDEPRLAKLQAAITEWQKGEHKSPPVPPKPVDPNAGPVSIDKTGVGVHIPGNYKKSTDQDPDWFAISCAGGKITVTLGLDNYEFDTLYVEDESSSQKFAVLAYSLANKHVFDTEFQTTTLKPHVVDTNSKFLVFDLAPYLTGPVDSVTPVWDQNGFRLYFNDPGRAASCTSAGS